jgi:transcriptional regulator with XRE-family HTH domain
MNKITVSQLLNQRGMTWYGLHRLTGMSKSMCHDWFRGRHLPSNRSAARIARALGISPDSLLTRDQWDNLPRTPWATNTRKALQEAGTLTDFKDRIDPAGLVCPHCHQILGKVA